MERKRPDDYASEDWFPAADTCQDCGAGYDILLESMTRDDVATQTTTARIRCQHAATCDAWDETDQEEEAQVVGWWWDPSGRTVELLGVRYPLYGGMAEVYPCVACWRLIVGVPLLLFESNRVGASGAVAFCHGCVEARGLWQMLESGR